MEIHSFDINPKREQIQHHDARRPLPIKADWIFADPPYFGQSKHLFDGDLAQTCDYYEYLSALTEVIQATCESLNPEGIFCLFLPKWSGASPDDPNHDVPGDVKTIAVKRGFEWIDAAYVSRGRQQELGSAIKNNHAKQMRRMRSDSCILNVFKKG